MDKQDERGAPRKYADYVVEFYDSEGFLLLGVGRLLDLSATGALVESSLRLTVEDKVLVRLRRGRHSDVDLSATVVRVRHKASTATYGLRFIRT